MGGELHEQEQDVGMEEDEEARWRTRIRGWPNKQQKQQQGDESRTAWGTSEQEEYE